MKKTHIKPLFIAILLIVSISGCNSENISSDAPIAEQTEAETVSQDIAELFDVRWWHYFREGDYRSSLKVLDLTLELIELQDLHQIAEFYNRKGTLHNYLGNYEQSEFYLNRVLEITQIDNGILTRLRALRNLVALYALYYDTENIATAIDVTAIVCDSLLFKQYEAKRTSNLLDQQAQNAQYKQSTIAFLSIIIVLIIALFVLAILFYRSKLHEAGITVRHYEELLKLKKEVREQQKDTDLEKIDAAEKLASDVQKLFEKEKLYKQQGLSVDDVAKKLQTSCRQLSNAISSHYQKNFIEYVNTFRVEEAIEMLKQQHEGGKYAHYTIEAIGKTVGFNHKSPFYAAFKRIIGVSPLEYMDNINEEEIENKHISRK